MKEVLADAAQDIHEMGAAFNPYAEFVDQESQARYATYYAPYVLPDPLQNWTAAKEILDAYHTDMPDCKKDALINARTQRAAYYSDGYVYSTFFIPEGVLDIAPLDEPSWKVQLRHLINMASAPHISLRIIPKDCFTVAEGMTALLDMPDGKYVTYLQSVLRGDEISTDERLAERVMHMFRGLGAAALDETASIGRILQRIKPV